MIVIRVVNNKTEREKKREKKKKEVNKAGRPSMTTMILDRTSHEFLLFLLLFFFSFSWFVLVLVLVLVPVPVPVPLRLRPLSLPLGSEKFPRLNRTDSTVIRKKNKLYYVCKYPQVG